MDGFNGGFLKGPEDADTAGKVPKLSENAYLSAGNVPGQNFYELDLRRKCDDYGRSNIQASPSTSPAHQRDMGLRFSDFPFISTAVNLRSINAQPFRGPELNRSLSSSLLESFDPMAQMSSIYPNGVMDSPRSLVAAASPRDASVAHDNEVDPEFNMFSKSALDTQSPTSCSFAERFRQADELFSTEVFAASVLSSPMILELGSALSSSLQSSPLIQSEVPDSLPKMSYSSTSPSKHDSPMNNYEDSDADLKNQNTKRRKTQLKRVVCVPITGDGKQKGEAPPSDLWTWRKYGQKPIKGSPYPRGYYRCSSSKGCSARKQVERSSRDPSLLVITYTSDHNHPWPANRNSSAAANRLVSQGNASVQVAVLDETNCDDPQNFFSSIINSPPIMQEQMVSSVKFMHSEESMCLERDVDLCLSRSSTEEDDFFADLGELPELAAIFRKGFLEERSIEETRNKNGDAHSIFNWASNALLVENKVVS